MSDRPFAGMSAKEFAERYANRRIDVCPGATPYTARVVGYEPGGVLRVERDDGRSDASTVPRSFAHTAPGDAPWSTQTAYVRRVLDEPVSCVPPKGAAFTAENFVAAMVDASKPHAKAQPPCECRKYGEGWHGAACSRFAAECCRETSARSYVCTLLRGHTGEHVARTSAAYHAVVAANWPNTEKPAAPLAAALPADEASFAAAHRGRMPGNQPASGGYAHPGPCLRRVVVRDSAGVPLATTCDECGNMFSAPAAKPKCGHRSVHGSVCDRAPHDSGKHWGTHGSGRVTWDGAPPAKPNPYTGRGEPQGLASYLITAPIAECERCGTRWGYHPGITCPKCKRPSIRRLKADTARAERWERTLVCVGYDEELP